MCSYCFFEHVILHPLVVVQYQRMAGAIPQTTTIFLDWYLVSIPRAIALNTLYQCVIIHYSRLMEGNGLTIWIPGHYHSSYTGPPVLISRHRYFVGFALGIHTWSHVCSLHTVTIDLLPPSMALYLSTVPTHIPSVSDNLYCFDLEYARRLGASWYTPHRLSRVTIELIN